MKTEDLPHYSPGETPGLDGTPDEFVMTPDPRGFWVHTHDLPHRHPTTEPPKHGGTVLVGWDDSEWYGLGRWNPGGEIIKARFVTPTGVTYPKQPDWWCELLIPPPLKEGKP